MNKHTPGPWSAYDEGNTIAGPVDGFTPYGACGCCSSPWVNGADDEEKLANARLIAAAPDLLAALEIISSLSMSQFYKPQDLGNAAINLASAAIAKATGHE